MEWNFFKMKWNQLKRKVELQRREPASEVELWEIMAGAAGPRQGAHNEDERLAVEQTNQTIQRNKMNLICLVVAWRAELICLFFFRQLK